MTICVFASSSGRIDNEYFMAAASLGRLLAGTGRDVVFGGGGIGLMGALADAVIENNGKITGVIPGFMQEHGWDHKGVTEMIVTTDMGDRKKQMFALADAVVALPGGVGTLEELAEAITLKQLGLFRGAVIVLNTLDFYKPLIEFFNKMVDGQFLRKEHKDIWQIAHYPDEVIEILSCYKPWIHDPRSIAKI